MTERETVKPVVNIDELDYIHWSDNKGENGAARKFEAEYSHVSSRIGAEKLGYSIYRVPPGKAAYPFHLHHGLEEMFMILEGQGILRFGADEYPVRRGDIIACPPGPGPDGKSRAHQIRNDGGDVLVYLSLSDMGSPEVVEYPDSGKFAARAAKRWTGNPADVDFRAIARVSDGVDYWDGEV